VNARHPQIVILIAAIGLGLQLAACIPTSTPRGDARLIHTPSWPSGVVDHLSFPHVPIGKCASFTYHVKDLQNPVYPGGFVLKVPWSEASADRHDQPWRSTIIHASLSEEGAAPFYQRTIDFADWNGGVADVVGSKRLFFGFTELGPNRPHLAKHTSYTLRVTVVRPSARASDDVVIQAFDLVGTRTRNSQKH